MSDPTVPELVAEAARLPRENRALRWLAEFPEDMDLTVILAAAEAHDSLDDVLMFLDWALERKVVPLPDELFECEFERPMRGESAPVF